MQLTYVVLSGLSLLNMGVQGATIARALTSKHCNDVQQTQKIVQHRQFHNADFISCSGTGDGNNFGAVQAAKLSTRDNVLDNTGVNVQDQDKNGLTATPNPAFYKYIMNSDDGTSMSQPASPTDTGATDVEIAANQDQTDSDPSSASSTETPSQPSLAGETAVLTSLLGGNSLPLGSSLGDPTQAITYLESGLGDSMSSMSSLGSELSSLVRRQDDEGDQTEASKALDVVSSSLESPSTLEANSVAPQAFERFLKQKREDGVLESDVAGEPVLRQNIPTDVAKGVMTSRGMNVRFPHHTPRD